MLQIGFCLLLKILETQSIVPSFQICRNTLFLRHLFTISSHSFPECFNKCCSPAVSTPTMPWAFSFSFFLTTALFLMIPKSYVWLQMTTANLQSELAGASTLTSTTEKYLRMNPFFLGPYPMVVLTSNSSLRPFILALFACFFHSFFTS